MLSRYLLLSPSSRPPLPLLSPLISPSYLPSYSYLLFFLSGGLAGGDSGGDLARSFYRFHCFCLCERVCGPCGSNVHGTTNGMHARIEGMGGSREGRRKERREEGGGRGEQVGRGEKEGEEFCN